MQAINRAIHLGSLFYGRFNQVLKNNKVHFKDIYIAHNNLKVANSYAKIDESYAIYLLKTEAKDK